MSVGWRGAHYTIGSRGFLSIAELLVDANRPTKRTLTEVIELAKGVANDSDIHANLLFCKAQALHQLGLLTPARNERTKFLRKRSHRSTELLQAARYERALVYEALNQEARARSDFESLYADDPSHKDVGERLGLAFSHDAQRPMETSKLSSWPV